MSLNVEPLESVLVYEPRLNLNSKKFYAIKRGGQDVAPQPQPAQSSSTSNMEFQCNPPNPNVAVDRLCWVSVPVQIVMTGTGPTVGPSHNLLDDCPQSPAYNGVAAQGFRSYPLSKVTSNLKININDNSVSIPMNEVIDGLQHYYNNDRMQFLSYSMTPSQQDQYQNYSEALNSARNPLAGYNDQGPHDMPRGAFPFTITAQSPTSATVNAILTEPIWLSPFLFSGDDTIDEEEGLIGVQTMKMTFTLQNLQGAFSRLWSSVNPADVAAGTVSTITNFVVTFPQLPQLLFTYVTPNDIQPIPAAPVYPYYTIDWYPTFAGSIAPGASFTVSSQNVQFNSIPNQVYIWARQQNSDLNSYSTDTYANLESLSITFNNKTGILASASAQDLYNIAVENGCNLSFPQWNSHCGSVLSLQFGKDIPLGPLEAAGLSGTYQFKITATMNNPNTLHAINYELYIVTISEGTMTVVNQHTVTQVGVISKQNILDAKVSNNVNYNMIKRVYGGNFLSGLKSFISKVGDIGSKVLPYAKAALPLARQILGVGEGEGGKRKKAKRSRKGSSLAVSASGKRGRPRKSRKGAGVVVGGKMMSQMALRDRLM
jgi:hypothetical protein